MKKKRDQQKRLSRRHVLPMLGSTLLFPILGFGKSGQFEKTPEEEEYEILMRADGKAVKVRRSALKNAKIVKTGISNSSLLKWLGKRI